MLLAIDPSLHNTGYAFRDESGKIQAAKLHLPNRGAEEYCLNLVEIRDHFAPLLDQLGVSRVVLEAGIYGGAERRFKSWGRERLTEVRAILKLLFAERGIPVLNVYPTSLKKYVAGNGRASKDEVMLAVNLKTGLLLGDDDEADAVGLLLIGEAYLQVIERFAKPWGTKLTDVAEELTAVMETLCPVSG